MAREKTFNVEFHVEAATSRTDFDGTHATVYADLVLWYPEEGLSRNQEVQHWRFSFVKQDGWRLCGADRL
jgi:hypothetical protein